MTGPDIDKLLADLPKPEKTMTNTSPETLTREDLQVIIDAFNGDGGTEVLFGERRTGMDVLARQLLASMQENELLLTLLTDHHNRVDDSQYFSSSLCKETNQALQKGSV